jgi:TniQ
MLDSPFSPFRQYPIRPSRIKGESYRGYVYRFLSVNGHQVSLEQNLALIRMFSNDKETVTKYFTFFQQALEGIWYFKLEDWLYRFENKTPYEKERDDRTQIKLYFCPACIKVRPIHIDLWEYPSVLACPEHRCKLVEKCTKCERALEWNRILPDFICKCGQLIAEIKPEKSSTHFVRVAAAIAFHKKEALPNDFVIRCRYAFPAKVPPFRMPLPRSRSYPIQVKKWANIS